MFAAMIGLVLTQGREKNIGARLGAGLYGLYGITGYIGDLCILFKTYGSRTCHWILLVGP